MEENGSHLRRLDEIETTTPSPSPQLDAIYRERIKRNANRPECDEAVWLCVRAWTDLAADRPAWNLLLGPIPYSALSLWASDQGLDRELTMLVRTVISKLDNDRTRVATAKAALNTPRGRQR